MKLKDAVWRLLEDKSTPSELNFMKRYEHMIKELEILIRKGEVKHQEEVKRGDGPPVILGG